MDELGDTVRAADHRDGNDSLAGILGWRERLSGRVLGISAATSTRAAVAMTVAGLAASWGLAFGLGGASVVPPHWFYVPIAFAAVRFGARGAVLTALASTALAGPALPGDAFAATTQTLTHWAVHGGFFLLVGVVLGFLLFEGRPARIRRLEVLRVDRPLRSELAEDRFEVHYQPVFEFWGHEPRLVGAEALLRWRHHAAGC
jgi:MFS family permease